MNPVQSQEFHLSGIVIDVPPEQAPEDAWTGGANIYFDDGGTIRTGGTDTFIAAGGPPTHLRPLQLPDTYYWLYAAEEGFFVTDGVSTFDITPAVYTTFREPADWTSCELNGVPCFNNGIDPPFYWDGNTGNICVPLPGFPANTTCKALRAYKYHLFAMNITVSGVDDPDLLYWSEAADPGTIPASWTPTETNDAGSTTLSASPGGIVDAEKLRDQFIIYKSSTTYLASYVAGGFVFNFRKLLLNSGIQSRNCVVEQGGYHIVLTQDDILKHDGQQSQSMLDGALRNFLFELIDTTNFANACMAARHSDDEIWIGVPATGSKYVNAILVFNYLEGKFGVRYPSGPISHFIGGIVPNAIDRTYDAQTTDYDSNISIYNQANYSPTADLMVMGSVDKISLLVADRVSDDLGNPVNSSVTRTGMEFGNPSMQKFVSRVWPRITGNGGDVVNVRIGGQRFYDDPVDWCPAQPYVIGDTDFIAVTCPGKFVGIEFSSSGGAKWRLDSFGLDYVDKGRY